MKAYTVELEAELNQLKEENAQLKHALGELERKRKQQYFESLKTRAQPKLPKASGRLRTLKEHILIFSTYVLVDKEVILCFNVMNLLEDIASVMLLVLVTILPKDMFQFGSSFGEYSNRDHYSWSKYQ
ncbi:unnamed protein product [Brassica napus]|uniref:(rape) hypothetical protein n=1 Tax=Brassica napus TaxID=3708 RepID=A0A816JQT4_BRANA|nr:unnamed protein product [Brassica napus]